MPLTAIDLDNALWAACDDLRGQVDAISYKDYLVPLLCLKRWSDRADELETLPAGEPRTVTFDPVIPAQARWDVLRSRHECLGETLDTAMLAIETANAPLLDGVLSGVRWADPFTLGPQPLRDQTIGALFARLDRLDLRDANLEGSSVDVVGDAYEHLLERFAASTKLAGEFYTPRGVTRLLAALLAPLEGMRICDPTAGTSGLLLAAAAYVTEHGGNAATLDLHGQERNLATRAVGKLNLLLHGFPHARYEGGDVIASPQLVNDEGLLTYDAALLNPPFSLKNWDRDGASADPYGRFTAFGPPPPPSRGDLAFVLHAVAITRPAGMVAAVVPHGVLFRGGAELAIRRGMIEADLFETIISLPPRLFFGTGIPVSVCVLNHDKAPDRRGRTIFIDATGDDSFLRGKRHNQLDPAHVERIAQAARDFTDDDRFAHVAGLSEIAANDYTLNVGRYISAAPPPAPLPSIEEALAALLAIEAKAEEAKRNMYEQLAKIGLTPERLSRLTEEPDEYAA